MHHDKLASKFDWLALLAAASISCSGSANEAPTAFAPEPTPPTVIAPPALPTIAELPPRAVIAEPRDRLLVERSTRVYASPSREAEVLGVIASGARVEKIQTREAASCALGWVEIAPRGWLCTKTSATDEPLTVLALPHLDRKRAVPGTSGVIREGRHVFADRAAVKANDGVAASGRRVRMAGTLRLGDTIYWQIEGGALVAARDVRRSRGSSFEGVFLDDDSELRLPIAFAHKSRARGEKVRIYDEPGGRAIGALEPREAVNIKGTTHNGRWLELESDGWIAGEDARLVEAAAPPRTVGQAETWLDFHRDRQVIVLYRGASPVYATLTSSGKRGHRTPVGVYRVEKKIAKTTMSSRPDADEPYEVKNVPWTLFFHQGFAVHGAYWHNKFGTPVSHGCMNLAPTDAKLVYELLGPVVPAGWSVVTATDEHPGAVVRVKTDASPTPALRGSAERFANRDGHPAAVATR